VWQGRRGDPSSYADGLLLVLHPGAHQMAEAAADEEAVGAIFAVAGVICVPCSEIERLCPARENPREETKVGQQRPVLCYKTVP
jgi:hypothetical protein